MKPAILALLAKDRRGVSSAEYALLLAVAGTALALSSFTLARAVGDSLTGSASLLASSAESGDGGGAAVAVASGVPDAATGGGDASTTRTIDLGSADCRKGSAPADAQICRNTVASLH